MHQGVCAYHLEGVFGIGTLDDWGCGAWKFGGSEAVVASEPLWRKAVVRTCCQPHALEDL